MNLDGRKLTFASLHYPIHVAECGQMGPKFSAKANGHEKAYDMTINGDFVWIKALIVQGPLKGALSDILVPLSSFSHMVLAPEDKAPAAKK